MLPILQAAFENTLKAHVSTMTLFFKLENTKIDIEKISDLFENQTSDQWLSLWNGKPYLVRIQGSRKTKNSSFRSFSNSISLTTKPCEKKTICAKMFRNGGIQVTGCPSEEKAYQVVGDIARFLYTIETCILSPKIESMVINMINIICNIKAIMNNRVFNLEHLNELLQQHSKVLVTKYDRDKYFGLSVKVPLQKEQPEIKKTSLLQMKRANPMATILVFSSGMFVVTGVKCKEHVQIVFDEFIKVFENVYEQCVIS
jgi:TATA-box binding protein (TBP) (component of TFIID and TFIIIB)